jgi:mRNA deadenylase 3'-5' endonuclease subunit Ccr4
MSTSSIARPDVRVTTYNVLSSALATPSNMPFNSAEALDPDRRLALVMRKLEVRMVRSPSS